jgi:small-conductance mechanosensitive channel
MDGVNFTELEQIGRVSIGAGSFLGAVVIIMMAILLDRFLVSQVKRGAKKAKMKEKTLFAVEKVVRFSVWIAAFAALFHVFGFTLEGLVLSAGLIGAALTIVSQNLVSSFIAGLYLGFAKPFGYGDMIKVGEFRGTVIDIGLVSTKMKTWQNEVVTIPNSKFLSTEVINYDVLDSKNVVEVNISISYGSDLEKAKKIMAGIIGRRARGDERVLDKPEPVVITRNFGENGIELQLRYWVDNIRNMLTTSSEIRDEMKARFDKAGIVIPFQQRTIWYGKEGGRRKMSPK